MLPEIAQARPTLLPNTLERMTFVLSQMLNDISSISGDQPSASNRTNGHVNPAEDDDQGDGGGPGGVAGGILGVGGGPGGRYSPPVDASAGGERSLGTSSDQLEDQLASLRSSFVNR